MSELVVRGQSVRCKRFWQQCDLAKVQHDRVSLLVDAELAGVHVGLYPYEPLPAETDTSRARKHGPVGLWRDRTVARIFCNVHFVLVPQVRSCSRVFGLVG